MTLLDHALEYASWDWPIFPCKRSKAPLTERGFQDATTDPEQLKAWWNKWPEASIGFALPEDMVVLDIDVKHNVGKYGDESLAAFEEEHGDLPETILSLTGGGGLQYFFTVDKPVKNATDLLPSIDVRTKGGYVILPPSHHESGNDYEWEAMHEPTTTAPVMLPESLYKLMTAQKPRTTKELPKQIVEGGRNDTLFRLACSLRSKGLTETEILAAISQANQDRCAPPLPDREVTELVKSAARYDCGGEQHRPTVPAVCTVKPIDFSDVGNSYIFAEKYREIACYSPQTDWLVWNGQRWEESELRAAGLAMKLTDEMLKEANSALRDAGAALTESEVLEDIEAKAAAMRKRKAAEEYRKHAKTSRGQNRVYALLKLARTHLAIDAALIDADPFSLNTPGGIVDLKTGKLTPHDPKAMCSKITKVAPGQKGENLWHDAVRTVTGGDDKLAYFLQQVAGMAIIGQVFEENLIIATGSGANGKSGFFNAWAYVLGDYSGTIAADSLTTNARSKGAELAELRGKRLVIAAELEEEARLSTSMLKQMTSTDRIHAERKYRDPEAFDPSHTLVLYTNFLPSIGSTDNGTWRRILTVPFNVTIPQEKRIKNYAQKLFTEAGEAVLSWMIQGAVEFCKNGYTLSIPDAVAEAVEEYQAENDWLTAFLSECCELGPGSVVGAGALYQEYRNFCDRTGGYKRHSKDFKAEMTKRGFFFAETKKRNEWHGLSISMSAIYRGIYGSGGG